MLPTSTMVLISNDRSLIESIQDVTRSLDRLRLLVVSSVEDACSMSDSGDVGLIVAHSTGDFAEIETLLRRVATLSHPVATLVLGDRDQPEHALKALRLGAVDYLLRPLDLGRFSYLADMLTLRMRHQQASQPAKAAPPQAPEDSTSFFYHTSPEMGRMMGQIRRIAPQDSTILLGGESGTGKTRLARLIHELSPRKDELFLVVNCGALSSNLIESEMFGHVRGAFTGADRDRVGKFTAVGRGTILLDEIDSLPADVQAKLLRVVEERVFEPVGSNKTLPVQARLIAASNRDLKRETAGGRFRLDLYYRLNVVGFVLPPLRDRPQSIAPLAARFVKEFASQYGRDARGISKEAIACLNAYDWPGNIRELRNVIERAVALGHGMEVQPEDLADPIHRGASPTLVGPTPSGAPALLGDSTLAESRGQAEYSRIREALEKHSNNRLRAASELGISRMTLYKKLYKYGFISKNLGSDRIPCPTDS